MLHPINPLHAKHTLGPYLLPLMRYARVVAILMKANYRTLEISDQLFLQAWVRSSGQIQKVFAHFTLHCLICLGTENLEQNLVSCPVNRCISTYHQACLERFLQLNPSCPNCRGAAVEAPVNQMSPFFHGNRLTENMARPPPVRKFWCFLDFIKLQTSCTEF